MPAGNVAHDATLDDARQYWRAHYRRLRAEHRARELAHIHNLNHRIKAAHTPVALIRRLQTEDNMRAKQHVAAQRKRTTK